MDKLSRLENPSQFGETRSERLFNVSLELCITWVNRILFLKLLEAQLITYHKGDKDYEFLNSKKIKSFDDLNGLFFQVLAKLQNDRNDDVKNIFANVPYLNSSLFEPTEIEHNALFISNLKDDKQLPIISSTVLKDSSGKKITGTRSTLEYIFDFLNSYDFSSEGSEDIQEENKTLINASVLGLIFEKINGYKDGSFFTPGFITEYMCRETIRRAVIQKFNVELENTSLNPSSRRDFKTNNPPLRGEQRGVLKTLDEVYDIIDENGKITRQKANDIINSITICDPAVGSGHFLVSALNEILAIKNDLRILQDRDGRRLKEYSVSVVNDELIITDENNSLFEYNYQNKESQRVQETIFHEKQTIIENCLFGVDINPNSVKICRLRLWIELLKHAYYKNQNELETLPNIDINIKCGNSLISRFEIDADLKQALKSSKWNIHSYRNAVATYRNAKSKEEKREMERLINDIKSDFRTEINKNSKEVKKLFKLEKEQYEKFVAPQMFGETLTPKQKKKLEEEHKKINKKIEEVKAEIEEIKNNKIYINAFEWRFEFPEVLSEEGDFIGFDIVIGNPPYVQIYKDKEYFSRNYITSKSGDLYALFFEKGIDILKLKGLFSYITPSLYIKGVNYLTLREFLLSNTLIIEILDKGDGVFTDVQMPTAITILVKSKVKDQNWNNFILNSNLLTKLSFSSSKLSELTTIQRGLEIGKKLILDLDSSNFKIISGSNVERYLINSFKSITNTTFEMFKKDEFYFTDERLLIRETGSQITTVFANEHFYHNRSLYSIKIIDKRTSIFALLGILNSKLIQFYYQSKYASNTNIFPKIRIIQVKELPIKIPTPEQETQITDLVNKILDAKKQDPEADTQGLEDKIDHLVYKLYDLNYEEVLIVDPETKLTREEY